MANTSLFMHKTTADASIVAVNDVTRSVDRHRETARQHPARRRICNSTGFARCLSPEREHSDPQTAKIASDKARRVQHPTYLNCFNQNAKDAPIRIGASFSAWFCIRNHQSGTPCRQAFAFAGAERNARKPGKTAFAVKLRVGQRAGNGIHASGIFPAQGQSALVSLPIASCATPASQRCPLPPAAPSMNQSRNFMVR